MAKRRKKKVGGVRRREPTYANTPWPKRDPVVRPPDSGLVMCAGSGVEVDVRLVCSECGYHPGLAPTQHAPTCTRW